MELIFEDVTKEQMEALKNLYKEIKAKEKEERIYKQCEQNIRAKIDFAIEQLGLEKTKQMMRSLNKELRMMKEEDA